MVFSSSAEVLCEFTRNYTKINELLNNLKPGDSSCLEEGLNKVSDLVMEEYGCFINTQIVLLTNNIETNQRDNSIKSLCLKIKENKSIIKSLLLANGIEIEEQIDSYYYTNSILNQELIKATQQNNVQNLTSKFFNCKYPFSFPNRFSIICLKSNESSSLNESPFSIFNFDDESFRLNQIKSKESKLGCKNRDLQHKVACLNELLALNNSSSGKLYVEYSANIPQQKEDEFCSKIYSDLFTSSNYKLKFGHLESNVFLSPPPAPYKGYLII